MSTKPLPLSPAADPDSDWSLPAWIYHDPEWHAAEMAKVMRPVLMNKVYSTDTMQRIARCAYDLIGGDGVLAPPRSVVLVVSRGRQGLGVEPCRHYVGDRAAHVLRHVLPQHRHPRAGSEQHLATVGLEVAGHEPHERGLAGAVAAEQADPLPRLDVARHVVEERRPAKPHADIAERDQRHDVSP
jgi:hypothetical protein